MAEIIRMPKSGLTMREGVLTKIHAKVGAAVKKGDIIMEFETDKTSGEITTGSDGIVLELYASEGETYEVLTPLGLVGIAGEKGDETAAEAPKAELEKSMEVTQAIQSLGRAITMPGGRLLASPFAKKLSRDYDIDITMLAGTGPNGRIQKKDVLAAIEAQHVRATPLAKKLARDNGIDIKSVSGSGPQGRIQKDDVLSSLAAASAPLASMQELPAAPMAPMQAQPQAASGGMRREKMSSMRKTIASRLTQSKQFIPHVYFKSDVDASALIDVKNKLAAASEKKLGKKISLNDIILLATARALSQFEIFNAQIDGNDIVYFDEVHLGFAVSLEKGLIVPVIKNADTLSLSQLSSQAAALSEKARSGKLTPDEFTGGTFSVSNLGAFGIDEFTAIINPPESGILAVGSLTERVVVQNGQMVIKPMLSLMLSVDHRLIDGAVAATFLKRVKDILEDAYSLLL